MELLKEIINDVFSVDIELSSRKREITDARMVYAKILRDIGYTCDAIGKSIKKHHSTITHYMKNADYFLQYDKELNRKYEFCKKEFLSSATNLPEKKSRNSTYVTIMILEQELEKAVADKNKVLDNFIDYIEQWEKTTGNFPNIKDLREHILPLFNK